MGEKVRLICLPSKYRFLFFSFSLRSQFEKVWEREREREKVSPRRISFSNAVVAKNSPNRNNGLNSIYPSSGEWGGTEEEAEKAFFLSVLIASTNATTWKKLFFRFCIWKESRFLRVSTKAIWRDKTFSSSVQSETNSWEFSINLCSKEQRISFFSSFYVRGEKAVRETEKDHNSKVLATLTKHFRRYVWPSRGGGKTSLSLYSYVLGHVNSEGRLIGPSLST